MQDEHVTQSAGQGGRGGATQAELVEAAEIFADLYEGDERQDIKTDVMNAFFAGAEWQRKQGSPNA
jgi:hypothetical protein